MNLLSGHFGQLAIIFIWLSDMYFHDKQLSLCVMA